MPIPTQFTLLMKADRRKQWKLLKAKHAKAISKAKLDFDQKLGPALDTYQSRVEKLVALAGKTELTSVLVDPVLRTTEPLKKIAAGYKTTVKALEEPARKEMTALLTAIEQDVASWEELAVNTMGTIADGTTPEQKAATRAVTPHLDNIRSMCLTIVTRGTRAVGIYQKAKRTNATALASHYVEGCRLAGSASHELANLAQQVTAGSNYELFKSRAKAAEPLIQNALAAAKAFHDKWDINLDVTEFTCNSEVDCDALESNYKQLKQYLNDALAVLRKLP